MSGPLVLDTGGWLLALAGEPEYASALEAASLLYVPSLVLAEVDYHLRRRRAEMRRLITDLVQGAYLLEPATAEDLSRADKIDRKSLRWSWGWWRPPSPRSLNVWMCGESSPRTPTSWPCASDAAGTRHWS